MKRTEARKPITTPEAAYLKYVAQIDDVKVTIRPRDGFPMIFIRDSEFETYAAAFDYLQRISHELARGPEVAS